MAKDPAVRDSVAQEASDVASQEEKNKKSPGQGEFNWSGLF